jgi:hypothetical protein
MNQEDYIEKQIYQLGQVLKAMLSKFNLGSPPTSVAELTQELRHSISLENVNWEDSNRLSVMLEDDLWSAENAEELLSILVVMAESTKDIQDRNSIVENANRIIEMIQQNTDTFNMKRFELSERLNSLQ